MGEYFAEAFSVTNVSSVKVRVIKELGCIATVGHIYNDGGDEFFVQVSREDGGAGGQMKHTVRSGKSYEFKAGGKWEIGEVLITTNSATAVSGRIILK